MCIYVIIFVYTSGFRYRLQGTISKIISPSRRLQSLNMVQIRWIKFKTKIYLNISFGKQAVYYPHQGVPATLVEERDACGVGFIASLRYILNNQFAFACLITWQWNDFTSNEASHDIIQQALAACSCMEHRGACSADNISGDGAGFI